MCNKAAFYKQRNHHCASKFKGYYGEHPRRKAWREKFRASFNIPPANVRELDDKYELYLFAPGLEKDDFTIALMDDVLTISVKEKKEAQENWKRQEYSQKGFVRQFELNEKIDKANIAAKYENGVLILSLPKSEGLETKRQEITVV